MNVEKLLTTKAVAEILLVKPDTLRTWLRTGKLKGVKVGNRLWRVRESELEVFLREGEGKWQVPEMDPEAFLREDEGFHAGPQRHSPW